MATRRFSRIHAHMSHEHPARSSFYNANKASPTPAVDQLTRPGPCWVTAVSPKAKRPGLLEPEGVAAKVTSELSSSTSLKSDAPGCRELGGGGVYR